MAERMEIEMTQKDLYLKIPVKAITKRYDVSEDRFSTRVVVDNRVINYWRDLYNQKIEEVEISYNPRTRRLEIKPIVGRGCCEKD